MRSLILTSALLLSSMAHAQLPSIIDPLINETPPGTNVTAGFFTISNESDQALVITDVSSTTIGHVEMHKSSVVNGVAKMEKQDAVTVKANSSLAFEHGSYHLMFMNLDKPLPAGEVVEVILSTSKGDLLIEMPVVNPNESAMQHDNEEMKHEQHANKEMHDNANDAPTEQVEAHAEQSEQAENPEKSEEVN